MRRSRSFHPLMIAVTVVFILLGAFHVQAMAGSAASSLHRNYRSIRIECGDTLWSIAETYCGGTSYMDIRNYVRELKKMNHIEDEFSLRSGAFLMVYDTAG